MQKLALFKLIKTKNGHEILELCGIFDSQEEVVAYLDEIQKMIEQQFQHQLEGEYFTLPSFYFNIKRREYDAKKEQFKNHKPNEPKNSR